MKAQPASGVYALLADGAAVEIGSRRAKCSEIGVSCLTCGSRPIDQVHQDHGLYDLADAGGTVEL